MPRIEYGTSHSPFQGEIVSGDAMVILEMEHGLFAAIVDVLGHGRQAHDVASEIENYLKAHADLNLLNLLGNLDKEMKGGRGAAIGLCFVEPERGKLRYVGVGNTTIRRFGDQETRLVSKSGIVGQYLPNLAEQVMWLNPGEVVLLYTDGVASHFTFQEYPHLFRDDPWTIARTVVNVFGKEHDDSACIALRYEK